MTEIEQPSRLYVFENDAAKEIENVTKRFQGPDFWKRKVKFECLPPILFEARPIEDTSNKQQYYFLETAFTLFPQNNNDEFQLTFRKPLITVRRVYPSSHSVVISTIKENTTDHSSRNIKAGTNGHAGINLSSERINIDGELEYEKKKTYTKEEVSYYSKEVYTIQSGGSESEFARWFFRILEDRQIGQQSEYRVAVEFK